MLEEEKRGGLEIHSPPSVDENCWPIGSISELPVCHTPYAGCPGYSAPDYADNARLLRNSQFATPHNDTVGLAMKARDNKIGFFLSPTAMGE